MKRIGRIPLVALDLRVAGHPDAGGARAAGAETGDRADHRLEGSGASPATIRQTVGQYHKDVASLKDNDPRAERLAEALRKAWESAPVVAALNNRRVRLCGFLVALEGDGKAVSEFLLVPYFGACIHVPPPPSNQIVLVRTGTSRSRSTGCSRWSRSQGDCARNRARNDLASASYVIEATQAAP